MPGKPAAVCAEGRERAGAVEAFPSDVGEYQPGTLADLDRYWKFFLATSWAQRYDAACLEQFWQQMATANFVPIHHSRRYAEANAPHYRVVLRALVEGPGFP
jgi:acyl carrier protein phosphodiesterase